MRITRGRTRELPAASRLFSSPNMLKLSILEGGSNASACITRPVAPPAVHADRLGRAVRGRAEIRRQADAGARMERAGRTRDCASLRAREGCRALGRVA